MRQLSALHKSDPAGDQHAGERETSSLLYLRPDLVQMDSASNQSGANQHRLNIPNIYTAIWWYADYPNHYAGDGSKATRAEGQLVNEHFISQLVQALKDVEANIEDAGAAEGIFRPGEEGIIGNFIVNREYMEESVKQSFGGPYKRS